MNRHKHTVKKTVQYFSDFALHIWIILLLANILLVYTFHFYLHAQVKSTAPTIPTQEKSTSFRSFDADPSPSDSPSDVPPTLIPDPTDVVPPSPNGPLIGLSFSVPGIGSGGGNMSPIHPTRNVTIYLYPTGVNSLDKKIRPVNTIRTKAYYDTNKLSPTYTSFINPKVDLGASVANGDYQILVKTDKSFRILSKDKPDSVGGIVYTLEKRATGDDFQSIPHLTMIMGDLFPADGDNVVDLADYNTLVNCFQLSRGTPVCPDPYAADINDDGRVDGLDYNVMVLSYGVLQDQGITVPQLIIPPTGSEVSRLSYLTPKVTKSPASSIPTKAPTVVKNSGGGGILGVIFFILFLVILGGVGFLLYLKNPQVKAMVDGIIHRSPPLRPEATTPSADKQDSAGQAGGTPSQTEGQPTQTEAQTPPAQQNQQAQQTQPPQSSSPSAPAGEAKEYFVKKQAEDEAKTGFWLTITDDNGPTLAHYTGKEVTDGFAKLKGEMKTENGKTFMEITELTPEA